MNILLDLFPRVADFSAEVLVPFVEAVHSSAAVQSLSAEAVNYIFEFLLPFEADLNLFPVDAFDTGPQHLLSQPACNNMVPFCEVYNIITV